MSYRNDQSKKSSTALDQASTLLAVVELSRNSWLVAGIVPGIDRHPLKKLGFDENGLLALLHRWQQQAVKAGREIKRVVVAFEAGRDGFWHARWLRARGIEPHVIHATSIACHESIVARRPIALTPNTLNGSSLGGCAVSPITAEWWRFRPSRKRMRNVPTGSVKR
jgi:transposase